MLSVSTFVTFTSSVALTVTIFVTVCCAERHANEVDVPAYREKVKQMFYHAYDGYLKYAYPYDELKPLTCKGHDTWGSYSLTLIDAMDTLAVMGNYSEFRRIANIVIDKGENAFDMDINVSVFETNIRIVGGLISAHLLMKRAGMQLEAAWPCSGPLLRMADTIARKLLPAFDTPTGMPYGTVNLRKGVPKGETPVTCTAGVGTFIVEFGTLSRLTGDPIFEKTAVRAIRSLWKYRSSLGLLGNHIDVKTGKWTAQDAGIGGGVDSYFEYLVKGSILFNLPELTHLFREYEVSIQKYLKKDDWYMWAQMNKGTITLPMFTSLDAFWPSIQMMLGDVDSAMKTLHNFQMVWRQFGFTPEYYNIPKSEPHKGREGYPLRPELIESIMYLYRATKDPGLLKMGVDIVEAIERQARTDCGYATIKDVKDHRLDDRMESFFLSETAKYLYLLFDTENFIHNNGSHGQVVDTPSGSCVIEAGGYIFNTEAHPIDLAAVHCCSAKKLEEDKLLEDFHSNLDLLSLLNLVEDEDEFLGMADWRNKKGKKEKTKVKKNKEEEAESGSKVSSRDDGILKESKRGNDNEEKGVFKMKQEKNDNENLVKDSTKVGVKADAVEKLLERTLNVEHPESNLNNKQTTGVNLEVALPSGPERIDDGNERIDDGNERIQSTSKLLTKTKLTEVEENVMKIFTDALNISTDDTSFVAEKLESEFKGTQYEKIAQRLVANMLQEGIDKEMKSREIRKAENDNQILPRVETVKEDKTAKNEEVLENLLSELSSILNDDKENSDASINAGNSEERKTNIDIEVIVKEKNKNDLGVNEGQDEQSSDDSDITGNTDNTSDKNDLNPALEKLRHHLETQIQEEKDNMKVSEAESASSIKSSNFLENRRENLLSLTKKALQLLSSLSSGKFLSLESVEDKEGDIDSNSSPSLSNLYATLGKQSLRYFDDPNIMHCPAQPFHSRLSVNGEFLVEE